MAEALLANTAQKTNASINVSSAGLGALVGYPADPIAQALMQARGIDISTHRARQITPEMAFGADLILTMTQEQTLQTETLFPGVRGRVHRVGKWGEYDVLDPYKRPKAIFEQAFILIEQGIEAWHKQLWA